MILEDIRNIKSNPRELRKFGMTIAVALTILGTILFFRGKHHFYYLYCIAALLLCFSFVYSKALLPFQKGWMTLSILLGWFMTRIILGVLFYTLFSLIGIIARLFGKGFLDLKIDKNCQTYWSDRKEVKKEKISYEKQF